MGRLPDGVSHGVVCGPGPAVMVSLDPDCFSPIGVGRVDMEWSNGRSFVAIVDDLDGGELCFAGPVGELAADEKVEPALGQFGAWLLRLCSAQFGLVDPIPKAVFLVWR